MEGLGAYRRGGISGPVVGRPGGGLYLAVAGERLPEQGLVNDVGQPPAELGPPHERLIQQAAGEGEDVQVVAEVYVGEVPEVRVGVG